MRQMSFALTVPQVRARAKFVTRRLGCKDAKPGMMVQAVDKVMGFRKGQHPVKLDVIRFVDVRFEPLRRLLDEPEYGAEEMVLEGFPDWAPSVFVEMLCIGSCCTPETIVTRIKFEYVEVNE